MKIFQRLFALTLLCALAGLSMQRPAACATATLVPRGSTWKYLDNGSDQGVAWQAPAFNDTAWAAGPARLGYGDTGEPNQQVTTVSYGPDATHKYITTYFRLSFN